MNIYYVTMSITVYQTCHNKQPRMIFGIYSNIKFWDLLLVNPDPIKFLAFNNLHNVQISFLSYCRWMMGVFITLNNILLGICFCTINAVTEEGNLESHWTIIELPPSPTAMVDMVYRCLALLLASENQLATIRLMDFPPPPSVLCFCSFLHHA